ncbi:uncharacterized protein ISCGN_008219 [Ixodes scapularis]
MDKPQKASTNANFSKTTSLQGRCRGSYLIRKCSRKESQDNRQGGRPVPTEPSEDDVRSRLGAYELETLHRKVAAAVNVPKEHKVYKGLTPLEFDKTELLKEEQKWVGFKRRQLPKNVKKEVKKDKADPDRSSLDKLSLTLSSSGHESTTSEECLAPKREFPEQTFTLENAPTCRAFCVSEGLREPRVKGSKFPQRK